MNQPKRMLLFGPGYGHNTEQKLRSLSDTSLFEVVFLAYQLDNTFQQKFPYIKFISSNFIVSIKHPLKTLMSVYSLFKQVRCSGHYDVVYSLGVSGIFGALTFWFANKKTKRAIEIWSNYILKTAKRNHTFFEKLDAYVLKRADLVCQYWWGIRERFIELFPGYGHKFLMYQLSYPDIYFSGEKHLPESDFVMSFLNRIPQDEIVCFWPRSFIQSNNHPLLLNALGIIKKRNPEILSHFKLYLWGGNVQQNSRVLEIKETIISNGLENNVEIVEHPFVSQNDIFAIEERSDLFVQIANDDILSTFIMEIICSGKPFVLSNLRTFQFLNEKYNLDIELVENDDVKIAGKIEKILQELKIRTVNNTRRDVCKKYFSQSMVKPSSQILYERLC